MKEKIHPKYEKVMVRCGCGSTFETHSTAKEIHAEICRYCRPNRAIPKEIRHELHQSGPSRQKTKREQKRPATIADSSGYDSCSHLDKTGLGAFCSFGQIQTDCSMAAQWLWIVISNL